MRHTQIPRRGKAAGLLILLLFLAGTQPVLAQLAFWNPAGLSGYGPSPFAPTSTDANVTVTGLERGAGLTTVNTAAANGWGANGWADNQATDEFTWSIAANSGYALSLSDITFCYRRSSTGPNAMTFQYALNGGAYTTITTVSCTSTGTNGVMMPAIDLTVFSDLQNVPSTTIVTFRVTGGGSTNAGGTFYLYSGSGGTGMNVNGTAVPAAVSCDAPAGLAAANITDGSADLSWDAVSGASGYEYTIDQNAGDPVSGTATASTTLNETGLSASTMYYLHVRTDCGGGNFSSWTTIPFTTLAAPCAAPTGLAAANITDGSADLSWDAVSGASGYEYVIDQNAGDPASGTATVSTTLNETGLSASTMYYLHVRTDCGGGNFSSWTTIPFTTLAAPCAAPTGLAAANITDGSADLSWDAVSGASGYEYTIDQNVGDPVSGTATTSTTLNETGLSASTMYYLHVRTDCGGGNFSSWTTISFTTLVAPCDAPAGLAAANITDGSADLSWDAVSGASGYEYAIDQNAGDPASGTATASTTLNETGLSASTMYYLHVRTDCGGGNFSSWTTITFTTLAAPCAAPTGLAAANITDGSADLSWDAVSGASGYEYAIDQNAGDPVSGTATASTTLNETGLSASTMYYLHVRTDCGGGNFSSWTTISFTTLAAPCAAPTGLNVTDITNTTATFGWTFQAGGQSYEYMVDQTAADPVTPGTGTGSNSGSVSGLLAGTVYYVHVRTDCGNGNFSNWATLQFTTQSIGIEELAAEAFSVYPNPAADLLTIETIGKASVTLVDVNGQALRTFEMNDQATIAVSGLASGIYFLHLEQNGAQAVRKVTIQ